MAKRKQHKKVSNSRDNKEKRLFMDVEKSIRLIKDYYVLFPVFFFYLGFIYIQGITFSIIPPGYDQSISYADLVEPNHYKEMFNTFFSNLSFMVSSFQVGTLPFSIEFYFIHGISFFCKFMLSLFISFFICYCVYSFFPYILKISFFSKVTKTFKNDGYERETKEKIVDWFILFLIFWISFSFVKAYFMVEILNHKGENTTLPFSPYFFLVKGNLVQHTLIYLKIGAYIASIFSSLILCYITKSIIKYTPVLIKNIITILILIILAYYPIISGAFIKVFVLHTLFSEISFNIYIILLYAIIFLLLVSKDIRNTQGKLVKKITPFLYIAIIFTTMTFNMYYLGRTVEMSNLLNFYNGNKTLSIATLVVDSSQKSLEKKKHKLYLKVDIGKDYFIGLNLDTLFMEVIPNKYIKNIELSEQYYVDNTYVPYVKSNMNKFEDEQVKAAKIIDQYYKLRTDVKNSNIKSWVSLMDKQAYAEKPLNVLEKEWETEKKLNNRKINEFIDYQKYVINPEVFTGDYVDIRVREYWKGTEQSVDYSVDTSAHKIISARIVEDSLIELEATPPGMYQLGEVYYKIFPEEKDE